MVTILPKMINNDGCTISTVCTALYGKGKTAPLNTVLSDIVSLVAEHEEHEADPVNTYREASQHFMRIVNTILVFVSESRSKTTATWAIAYALGSYMCEGVSVTDRADMLGITPQALSSQIKQFQLESGMAESEYMYKK